MPYQQKTNMTLFNTSRNGRPMMDFITDLKLKARFCSFRALEEGLVIDMAINKCNNKKIMEKLMEMSDEQMTLKNV